MENLLSSVYNLEILLTNFSFDDTCFQNDYQRQYLICKFIKRMKLILQEIIHYTKIIQIKKLNSKFNDNNIIDIILSYL